MATPCRHTFSGAAAACVIAAVSVAAWVPVVDSASAATAGPSAATVACPPSWGPLRSGPPAGDGYDGNVSVLVGGNLSVQGTAQGAEGVVVAHGDASFARAETGSYEVGVTGVGSQVPAYAGSDMLVVGGDVSGGAGTHLDIGQALGGDAVAGGAVADGTDADLHGGRFDQGVPDATAPYDELLGGLAAKSAGYAALPATGTTEVTAGAVTFTGDGSSAVQVFTLDAASLVAPPPPPPDDDGGDEPTPSPDQGRGGRTAFVSAGDRGHGAAAPKAPHAPAADLDDPADPPAAEGRSLQLLGVPAGASVVVNVVGETVDLDLDQLLAADGTPVNPYADQGFADLATHLLWNLPGATSVRVDGTAQLPGTLLVPGAGTTTLAGAGTNGRVWVGGDLVQLAGQLHSYPYLADADLTCTGEVAHFGTVTVDVEVVDPDGVVDPDRVYEGTFRCDLDGTDVTPSDNSWQARAGADPKVLSDDLPVGAVCEVRERLQAPPGADWRFEDPEYSPAEVEVAKRLPQDVLVTNRVTVVPQPPATQTSDPTPQPTSDPAPTTDPTPDPTPATDDTEDASSPEPTVAPTPTDDVTQPTPEPVVTAVPEDDGDDEPAAREPAARGAGPGPLTTTAPFTLRGAFVWGPLLMLSLLTMVLRTRGRPRHQRLH